jgi:hypothetical protein
MHFRHAPVANRLIVLGSKDENKSGMQLRRSFGPDSTCNQRAGRHIDSGRFLRRPLLLFRIQNLKGERILRPAGNAQDHPNQQRGDCSVCQQPAGAMMESRIQDRNSERGMKNDWPLHLVRSSPLFVLSLSSYSSCGPDVEGNGGKSRPKLSVTGNCTALGKEKKPRPFLSVAFPE